MPVLRVSSNARTTDATQICVQNKEKEVIHHIVGSRSVELHWRMLWIQNCMYVQGETGRVLRKGCCSWEFSGLRMSAWEESLERIAEEPHSCGIRNVCQLKSLETGSVWEKKCHACLFWLSIADHYSQFFLFKGTFLKHHMLVSIEIISIKIIGFRHTRY